MHKILKILGFFGKIFRGVLSSILCLARHKAARAEQEWLRCWWHRVEQVSEKPFGFPWKCYVLWQLGSATSGWCASTCIQCPCKSGESYQEMRAHPCTNTDDHRGHFLFLLQIKAYTQLKIAGLYPSAYWVGQAVVDLPLFFSILVLMIGSLFAFHYGIYFYVGKFMAVVSVVGTWGHTGVQGLGSVIFHKHLFLLDGSAGFSKTMYTENAWSGFLVQRHQPECTKGKTASSPEGGGGKYLGFNWEPE